MTSAYSLRSEVFRARITKVGAAYFRLPFRVNIRQHDAHDFAACFCYLACAGEHDFPAGCFPFHCKEDMVDLAGENAGVGNDEGGRATVIDY